MENFKKKIKFLARLLKIDTKNKRRQVSICEALKTINRVIIQNVWNELDYGLDVRGVAEKTETDFFFDKDFFSKHHCYPLQSSSFGQLHTDGDIVPIVGINTGILRPVWSSICLSHSFR
ncbi:hypothetical protein TNCV_480271 [Trichonephila clavipes]|nr:hypothetical protein TNCV_480271 [Trichonephila clavipes]